MRTKSFRRSAQIRPAKMRQSRCAKCLIHGEEMEHESKECKWKHCDCRKQRVCTTTYVCSRCRHHGIITVKKYHAPCPFALCKCEKCELFEEKKRIENALIMERHKDVNIDVASALPENLDIIDSSTEQRDQENSPEAKVILQLLEALASYPNTIAPANLDHEALHNLITNPDILLPENWKSQLPEIIELVHEALKRFNLIP